MSEMPSRLVYRSIFIVALTVAAIGIGCATVGPAYDSSPALPAKIEPPFPVPIVELSGSPAEIGTAEGDRLGGEIHFLFDHYLQPYFHSETQHFLAMMAASAFESKLLPEHLQELRALAKATQLDEREVMLAQCFLDLTPMTACSTITLPGAASIDGIPRFARNLDFPSLNVADKHTVLLIYHPTGRYSFAAVSWPGLMGVLSGMNEHGLTLACMEVTRGAGLPRAMPYTLLYRTILERCRTTAEAIALLRTTPRQTPNNLMLMDAAGDRAVVEITPESITVRRAPPTAGLISTNHHRGLDLDSPGFCRRYDFLHDRSAESFGQLTRQDVENMLAGAAQGSMTLHSMVIEPASRTIYLAVGADAPTHPFGRLDLRPYFASSH